MQIQIFTVVCHFFSKCSGQILFKHYRIIVGRITNPKKMIDLDQLFKDTDIKLNPRGGSLWVRFELKDPRLSNALELFVLFLALNYRAHSDH